MLAFCSSPRFVDHTTGPHHPERPDRIRAIHRAIREAGLIRLPDPFADFRIDLGIRPMPNTQALIEMESSPASLDQIRLVHSNEYIDRVRHVGEIGGVLDLGDTPVSAASFDVALLAVGAVIRCCDAVMRGEVQRAFAAVRPPGHHAEPDRPMGFCLFSNLAIGARYVQRTFGLERVAIVDFDVHHGNGTHAVFEDDPSVFFVSLHQHPRTLFPGSGYEWETGTGAGEGFTMNIPMRPGAGDDEYIAAMESRVIPALDAYNPQLLMISAGFDAHRDDPLANIELSDEGFSRITRVLVDFANRCCDGKIVSALEGGYNLVALGRSVVRHLLAMQQP